MKTGRRDYSISCVRFVAMILITVCHMMQKDHVVSWINEHEINWSYILNVGVQIFLFISGYLCGLKRNDTVVARFKKSFSRILVDYYIFVTVVTLINCAFLRLNIDASTPWKFITLTSHVPGLGHLWYIPTILFCYLIAPLLLPVMDTINQGKDWQFLIRCTLLQILIHVTIANHFQEFSAANINCFMMGMMLRFAEQRKDRMEQIMRYIIVICCACILIVRIIFEVLIQEQPVGLLANYYSLVTQYGHVFLGASIFLAVRSLYYRINEKKQKESHRVLNWSDRYSYDVYLTHHIFIQSGFACVEFIENRWIALPLAVLLTIPASMGLYWLSDRCRRMLIVRKGKEDEETKKI